MNTNITDIIKQIEDSRLRIAGEREVLRSLIDTLEDMAESCCQAELCLDNAVDHLGDIVEE